jgi:hypothetical protein
MVMRKPELHTIRVSFKEKYVNYYRDNHVFGIHYDNLKRLLSSGTNAITKGDYVMSERSASTPETWWVCTDQIGDENEPVFVFSECDKEDYHAIVNYLMLFH